MNTQTGLDHTASSLTAAERALINILYNNPSPNSVTITPQQCQSTEQQQQKQHVWDLQWKRLGALKLNSSFTQSDLTILFSLTIDGNLKRLLTESSTSPASYTIPTDIHLKLREALGQDQLLRISAFDLVRTESMYLLKHGLYHLQNNEEEILSVIFNLNWLYRKAVQHHDELYRSLIHHDMLSVPKDQQARLLCHVLKAGRAPFRYASRQEKHSRQIFAEFIWNKLAKVRHSSRGLQLIVYNCNMLRKSSLLSAPYSPVLADINNPLVGIHKNIQSGFVKSVVATSIDEFACADSHGAITVVNNNRTTTFSAHPGWEITGLCVAGDNLLVSASLDSTCKVWKRDSLVGTFDKHADSVRALSCNVNEHLVASGSDDGVVLVWHVRDFSVLHSFAGAHSGWILSVAIIRNRLASSSDDCTIRLWKNLDAGPQNTTVIRAHDNFVNEVVFVNQNLLLSGSSDRTVRVWNLLVEDEDPQELKCFTTPLPVNSITTNTTTLYVANGNKISVFDYASEKLERVLKGHSDTINQVTGFPDEDCFTLVSASDDKSVYFWNDFRLSHQQQVELPEFLVSCVTVDDSMIYMGCQSGVIKVFNLCTEQFEQEDLTEHRGSICSLVVAENVLCSGAADFRILIWKECKLLHELEGHLGPILNLSLQGNTLVSASKDRKVIVWDVSVVTSKRRFIMKGHSKDINSIIQTRIKALEIPHVALTASSDLSVRGWDLDSGHEIRMLTGHECPVQDIAMLEEDLCVSYDSKSVRVWDLAWGQQRYCVELNRIVKALVHENNVVHVALEAGQVHKLYLGRGESKTMWTVDNATQGEIGDLLYFKEKTGLVCGLKNERALVFLDDATGKVNFTSLDVYGGPLDHPSICGKIRVMMNVHDDKVFIGFDGSGYTVLVWH